MDSPFSGDGFEMQVLARGSLQISSYLQTDAAVGQQLLGCDILSAQRTVVVGKNLSYFWGDEIQNSLHNYILCLRAHIRPRTSCREV